MRCRHVCKSEVANTVPVRIRRERRGARLQCEERRLLARPLRLLSRVSQCLKVQTGCPRDRMFTFLPAAHGLLADT
jgi:hypothetical protein